MNPELCTQLNLKHDDKTEKLILDLHPKKEYGVHLKLLLLWMDLGLKVTKLHQIPIQSRQRGFLSFIYCWANAELAPLVVDDL